ncbi:MAG: hypothetical protein QM680_14475 [Luteolibacter sp.]
MPCTWRSMVANEECCLSIRTPTRGGLFSVTLGKETFTDRIEAGRKLVFMSASLKTYEETQKIGSIAGFGISLRNMGRGGSETPRQKMRSISP